MLIILSAILQIIPALQISGSIGKKGEIVTASGNNKVLDKIKETNTKKT